MAGCDMYPVNSAGHKQLQMMESVSTINQEAIVFLHENHASNQESSDSSSEYFSSSASSVSCKEAKVNLGHSASSFQEMLDSILDDNCTEKGLSQNMDLARKTQDFDRNVIVNGSCQLGFDSCSLRDGSLLRNVKKSVDSVTENLEGLAVSAEDAYAGLVGSCLNTETVLEEVGDSSGSKNGSTETSCMFPVVQDGARRVGGSRKDDSIVPCSLQIEVIDDTALICLPFPDARDGIGKRTENRALAENVFKNGKEKAVNSCEKGFGVIKFAKNTGRNVKEQIGGMKACRSALKGKGVKEPSGKNMWICVPPKHEDKAKRMYSRMELEALRYVNITNQQNLWKKVYNALGNVVLCEYNDLTSTANQNKFIRLGFDPRQSFERNGVAPVVPGLVATRGRRNHCNTYMHRGLV